MHKHIHIRIHTRMYNTMSRAQSHGCIISGHTVWMYNKITCAVIRMNDIRSRIQVVTCAFPGASVFAKRARGLMVKYIIENEVRVCLY